MRRFIVLLILLPVQFALADEVLLSSGEKLQCQVVEQTAQLVIVDHPILGRLEIPAEMVQEVLKDSKLEKMDKQSQPRTEAKPKHTPPLPKQEEKPKPHWRSKIEIGFSGASGNTEDANATFALTSILDRGYDKYSFDSRYSIRSSRGDRSENKLTAGLLAQWPLPDSGFNYFAQGRYDADEFQSWDSRVTGGAGIGYHLIDSNKLDESGNVIDVFDLGIKVGLGFLREFGSENERIQPEGILGTNLTWEISPRQRFAGDSTYYPNLDEKGEFRIVSKAEWIFDLDTLDGLSLKLGLLHEYQSQVDEGIEHSDLSVYGAIVLEF